MAADVRLARVARILHLAPPGPTAADARAAIAARTGEVAGALFAEAADNDDVTSTEAALDYLESRLSEFGDLVSPDAADRIRVAFRERLKAWE